VPPEWSDVIERLELHGIGVKRLDRPQLLHVTSYTFKNVRWRQWPYEGRHPVSFEIEAVEEERMYPKGSVVVDMNQRAARVAAHILEPEGPDSYVKWGFFDAIFEQKEYTESYVMEVMAREMLAEDDELRKAFEKKKAEDQEFAENPRAILNWFYLRSPYRDRRMKVYPVGKIMDRRAVEALDT